MISFELFPVGRDEFSEVAGYGQSIREAVNKGNIASDSIRIYGRIGEENLYFYCVKVLV